MKTRHPLIGSALPTPRVPRTDLIAFATALRDTIASQPSGCDPEILFSAMALHGLSRAQFDAIIANLIERGWVERRDSLLVPGMVARSRTPV
jgi:hypothetical protein